jgi:lipoprotein-releasing system permease protein
MYKAFLSLRYLRTRYIALASIVSVMLGVATMIVVNSVMRGFTSEMKSRIQGLLSDIVIETNSLDGKEDAQWHFDQIRGVAADKIAGMTATVEVWGLMTFQFGGQWTTRPITLIGIEPEGKASVGPFVKYLESYHPLVEGKKTLRPALRSHHHPPGWELTSEASAWRKEVKERIRWIDHRMRQHESSDQSDHEIEITAVSHTDPPARAPIIAANPTRPAAKAPLDLTKPASTAGSLKAPAAPQKPDAQDPFSEPIDSPGMLPPSPGAGPLVVQPPSDDEPLAARLYVGAGLVRFPIEDPKTHEIRTIDMVRPGEDVKISTVTAGRPPNPEHFTATIVDIFKCGMSEYDSNLVFCNLEFLQRVRGMIDPTNPEDPNHKGITSIQIKLKDFADAPEVIERLQAVFPPGTYTIKTWEQKQGPLLAAVEIETGILNVLLFLIIAVAGFGILAIFFMIVVEKTRDIGILKALGASSSGVMSIFLSYGVALGVVGSSVGVLLGLLIVRYINQIESAIATVTGRKVFDDKVYYFPEIPTRVEPWMIVWVTVGAIAIAVMASVLPARRAARLRPVEALRYE